MLCSLMFSAAVAFAAQADELKNDAYQLAIDLDGAVTVTVAGMPPQRLVPEFTVLYSPTDPRLRRNLSHPDFRLAVRPALRWYAASEPSEERNSSQTSPVKKAPPGTAANVDEEARGQRVEESHNAAGLLKFTVPDPPATGTTQPLAVGQKTLVRATGFLRADERLLRWQFAPQPQFSFTAELRLPPGTADPQLTYQLMPGRDGYYSVAFTGAPDMPRADLVTVPQECGGPQGRQSDFALGEADLKLPRVQIANAAGNVALVADPAECRFRLPTLADSRFGLMLAQDAGRMRPVCLAPLLGGCESQRKAGEPLRFTLRLVVRSGRWPDTYRHIAQQIFGFRDQRDATGPGSLNDCLERIIDFLADRNGHNYALWHDEQKYYDYFTDLTGVFKPFSPLPGLSAAVVTDDEDFYRRRARPAVEFALSRKVNVFTPYEAQHIIIKSAARELGGPYLGYAQLVSLHEFFQRRVPALKTLAEQAGPTAGILADGLARAQLSGEHAALDAVVKTARATLKREPSTSVQRLFDLADLHAATRDPQFLAAARDAAYGYATTLNLYPAPPDEQVRVDVGGHAPVHLHSFGRHHNVWGFMPPQPLAVPEQLVPAWRVARLGTPSPAYPMEYWMNAHAALLRVATASNDGFLRDIARWGMVGRFGNYPGDNRSQLSLVGELPDAVEHPPWDWNFATVNPGHAWDFAGAVLDFLVSDAYDRSGGAIDFPGESLAGCAFRVRAYGARPGRFYDADNVRLWLPRRLVQCDNRQLDWLAGYGNGQFYLALWSQSFREERATIRLDRSRVTCRNGPARAWIDNRPVDPPPVSADTLTIDVGPKGIVALAIPAEVRPQLQARLYAADAPPLAAGLVETQAPFGTVRALLLTAGRGLTSAFVYTDAPPEQVIAARLSWRQGGGPWREQIDEIYPYEFSPELADDGGDCEFVLDVETARQELQRAAVLRLALSAPAASAQPTVAGDLPPPRPIAAAAPPPAADRPPLDVSAEFLEYLQTAANPKRYGLRDDGRFYPYSTPQGRRIAWRQAVWNKDLYAHGCTREAAEHQLRADLARARSDLAAALAQRTPPVNLDRLTLPQQEILLDLALSEGAANLRAELLAVVLAGDGDTMAQQHLYVRYAGPAPDHPRNKAFAERWLYSGRLGVEAAAPAK